MKVMLIVPGHYKYGTILKKGFTSNGWDVEFCGWRDELSLMRGLIFKKTYALPYGLARYRDQYIEGWINDLYKKRFRQAEPDLVFVYNGQGICPSTLSYFKRQGAKIAFVLGDYPLYSNTSDNNLSILQFSDYTIVPDSYWIENLKRMGFPNLIHDFLWDDGLEIIPPNTMSENLTRLYNSDLLFMGRTYRSSAGYKRALFLSKFAGFNFKLFGFGRWDKWFDCFPVLNNKFHQMRYRVSNEEVKLAISQCKITPVDINPGVHNGIHLRVFEALSLNVFPLAEWTVDIDNLFGDSLLYVKEYSKIEDITNNLLKNNKEKSERIKVARRCLDNYKPNIVITRLLDCVF